MKKVVSQGTATRANIGRPQAGKTGTAQNFRDVWFMGYIPQYTTAVWVGYADAQIEMVNFRVFNDTTGKEQSYRRAFGGTLAAPIWKQFMLFATEDLPIEEFPPEPPGTGVYRITPSTEVPDVTDLTDEKEISDAIFKAGLFVTFEEIASTEPEGTVLEQSPKAGSRVTQGRTVTVRVSNGEAPTMPDLIGLRIGRIPGRIAAFNDRTGLQVTYVLELVPVTEDTNRNRVLASSPAPGADVTFQQQIVFFVGEPSVSEP